MSVLKKALSLIPLFILLSLFVFRVDYRLEAPGNLEPLDTFITFENAAESDADLSAIYIMSFNRPTIFQWWVAQYSPSIDVTPLSEAQLSISNTARFESGQVARNSSIDKAIITAYESLGLTITYEEKTLVYLIYDYASGQGLDIGDRIESVNGSNNIFDAFANATCGETAEVVVTKEDGTQETLALEKFEDEACRFGLSLSTYYEITSLPLEYETTSTIVGGPSAGLMHTLYIYAAQNPELKISDLKIAGTGTIGLDGSIGSVGSIKQKVYTAQSEHVDLLFIPSGSNFEEALLTYQSIQQPSFELVEVSTFDDVLNALEAAHEVD